MEKKSISTPLAAAFPLALLLSAAATGQQLQFAGTMQRNQPGGFTRGSAGSNAGELLQRFDADDMRGFGIEPGFPGVQVVRGIWMQAKTILPGFSDGGPRLSLYIEDPLRPNFPDLQSPLFVWNSAVGVSPPLAVNGDTYFALPTPVMVPIGQDLFVGYTVNASSGPVNGRMINILPSSATSTTGDLPGAGMPLSPPEEAGIRLFRNLTTDAMHYEVGGQYMIELITATPSGFPTALTNQGNFNVGLTPPGGTSMLSGLHPDAAFPPRNAGRADDVGFLFTDQGMQAGDPVLFLASLSGFGPVTPLDQMAPGSVGALCLPDLDAIPLAIVPLGTNFRASIVWTIDSAVRPLLLGNSWALQAIGYDSVDGVLRGSMCCRQRF